MGFYQELGVKTFINALGTVTKVGGSRMAPEVLAAMAEASENFVEIPALHKAAGERIASLLGVQACCVTCGAAAGLAISAAACLNRGDPAKKLLLPDTGGMPDEALALKCHRMLYDQALLLSGVKIREVGVTSFACPEQVEAAITGRTAFFFYAAEAEPMRGSIPLPELMPILQKHQIPVVVDAAAELPPKENIHKYLDYGADMVVFSGGKELRGPQSSGLILGKPEWIAACDENCCPNYGIGRCMKIDKETIAGIVKAVELFAAKDYSIQARRWEEMDHAISAALCALDACEVREGTPVEPGIQPADLPRVYIRPLRMSAQALQKALLDGETPVYVGVCGDEAVINPQCVEEDEVPALIRALQAALS